MKNSNLSFWNKQVALRLFVFVAAACFLTFYASAQIVTAPQATFAPQAVVVQQGYTPKSKEQLRQMLTDVQYYVTQQEGTERPFSNPYWNNVSEGVYHCVCCDKPLFKSDAKYKSGTGWPSFFRPIDSYAVETRSDTDPVLGTRVEVHCPRCKAHLGHVFNDGPRPTGKRYCMNSASLKFAGAMTTGVPVSVPAPRPVTVPAPAAIPAPAPITVPIQTTVQPIFIK